MKFSGGSHLEHDPMGIRLSKSLEIFKNIYKIYIHDTDMEWNNYE